MQKSLKYCFKKRLAIFRLSSFYFISAPLNKKRACLTFHMCIAFHTGGGAKAQQVGTSSAKPPKVAEIQPSAPGTADNDLYGVAALVAALKKTTPAKKKKEKSPSPPPKKEKKKSSSPIKKNKKRSRSKSRSRSRSKSKSSSHRTSKSSKRHRSKSRSQSRERRTSHRRTTPSPPPRRRPPVYHEHANSNPLPLMEPYQPPQQGRQDSWEQKAAEFLAKIGDGQKAVEMILSGG